jgi:hypothetical protein
MTKTIIAALAIALGTTAAYAADPADKSSGQHPPTKAVGEKAEQTPGTPGGQQAGGGEHPPQKAMDKAAAGQTEQDKAVKESQAAQDKAAAGGQSDKAVKESQGAQDKAAAGGQTDKQTTGAAGREGQQAAAGQGQGRNWDNIDKDNNNLVSAEEMEAWLQANPGPAAGSAGAAGKEGKEASKEPAAKEPAAADKEKKQ